MNAQSKKEFTELYKDAHEPLARFCMVKSYGVMDAKDLLSETVLASMEGFEKLRNKKAFLSYLFTIANNKVNAVLRRRKFHGPYEEERALAQVDINGASDARFDISVLYDALNELPEAQKEAVILFEISGFSIKEIMEIQNSGESAVKQRIRRGREKLALLFSEDRRKALAGVVILFFSQNANSTPSIDQLFEIAKSMEIPVSQEQIISIINNHQVPGAASNSAMANITYLGLSGMSMVIIVGLFFFAGNPISSELADKIEVPVETALSSPESNVKIHNVTSARASNNSNSGFNASASMMSSRSNMQLLVMDAPLQPIQNPEKNWDFGSYFSKSFVQTLAPSDTNKLVSQKSDALTAGTPINAQLSDCDIDVKIWDKDYVDVQSTVSFEAKNEKSEQLANEYFKVIVENNGKEVTIHSPKRKCHSTSSLKKYDKWSFENGDKAYLRKVDVNHTIYMPAESALKIKLTYGSLSLPDLKSDLSVYVFDGELDGGDVEGNLNLELRYSKAEMGKIASGSITLFNADLSFTEAENISMDTRYGKVTANSIKALDTKAFQGKFNIGKMETLTGSFRYTKCFSETIGKVELEAFESKLEAESTEQLKVSSGYSDYKITSVGTLKLPKSFNDTYVIKELKELEGQSKYSDFSISHLESSANMTTFQGKVNIDEVDRKFTSLSFDGRYTNFDIDFEAQSSYELSVDSKYTKLSYPEEKSSINQIVDKDFILKLNCHVNKSDNSSASVKFNCFEGHIALVE